MTLRKDYEHMMLYYIEQVVYPLGAFSLIV